MPSPTAPVAFLDTMTVQTNPPRPTTPSAFSMTEKLPVVAIQRDAQHQDGVLLDANKLASRSPVKPAAMSWPFPIDRRLDQLVDLANNSGANVRRNELAAALVAAAPAEPEQLLALVIAYRKTPVRDVVLDVDTAAQVVEIPRYRPGRRRSDGG